MTIELNLYSPSQTYPNQKTFDCGEKTINNFVVKSLKKQVRDGFSVAYVLTDTSKNNSFIGFYTLAQHSIHADLLSSVGLGSLPLHIPCTRLVMLGIENSYQGQKLGYRLMKDAITKSKQLSLSAGSYGIYLDAHPPAIEFYRNIQFVLLSDRTPNPSPMFLTLSSIP